MVSLLGLASTKAAISQREKNLTNPSEEYWQTLLAEHAGVLSQLFAYPILVIAQKAYVGGKRLANRGGKVVDFLARAAATGGLLLIEIKTPTTRLLGKEYREGIYTIVFGTKWRDCAGRALSSKSHEELRSSLRRIVAS